MNYFFEVKDRSPIPRVHPLLLSLSEVIEEAEMSPNLTTISEDDPRVLSSNFYASPGNFPPLDMHLSGQNGASLLFDPGDFALTSAAGCRDCMLSEPQDDLVGLGDAAIAARKGKRRRRASSGGVQRNSRTKRKAKGKQTQETPPRKLTVVCI
jgi:hypothetical protein